MKSTATLGEAQRTSRDVNKPHLRNKIKQPLLIFAHAHEPKFGLYKMFFLRIYFDVFSRSLFFPFAFPSDMQFCFPLYRPSFAWNCGWLTFLERDKFNLQRVAGKQQNWQWIFLQHVNLFSWGSVILSGLVRMPKTRYWWKDLSLLTLFLSYHFVRPLLALRWPEPIYVRVAWLCFWIAFVGRNDLTDFYDFWHP